MTERRTWLDRAIEGVSPAWAARRAFYRSMLTEARSYDAARTGRRTDGWHRPGTSANAEIGPAGARIRNSARDLVRNNPWAAQGVRKLAAKVIGTGIVPRVRGQGLSKTERQLGQDLWDAFVDHSDPEGQLDYYGQMHLAARTFFESGEVLLRFAPRPSSWGLRVPLQMQVLEPDYLDSSKTQTAPDGNMIIQGVEYDQHGRRVAYHLFDEHPGEALSTFTRRAGATHRVPADQIRHVFDPQRPGQARGVSIFTPVVLKLRDVDDFDDAEIMRKKIAACFAAFVKRGGGQAVSPLAGKAAQTDAAGRRLERLAPGMVQYLQLDEDVTFASPPASDGYLEFMTQQLHAVAAGVGITYEQLTGDLSRVNYSSIRAGMIDFWELIDHWQWHVIVPQACAPVFRRVGQLLVARGLWEATKPYEARWTPPRRRWVDPDKEVRALAAAVRNGFTTLDEAIAEQGEDPQERMAEMAEINARLDSLDLVLDSDPRQGRQPRQRRAAGG